MPENYLDEQQSRTFSPKPVDKKEKEPQSFTHEELFGDSPFVDTQKSFTHEELFGGDPFADTQKPKKERSWGSEAVESVKKHKLQHAIKNGNVVKE